MDIPVKSITVNDEKLSDNWNWFNWCNLRNDHTQLDLISKRRASSTSTASFPQKIPFYVTWRMERLENWKQFKRVVQKRYKEVFFFS